MINKNENPVEWALLLFELAEVEERIRNLIDEMNKRGEIAVEAYEVDVGHIYSHINRVWNSRLRLGEATDESFDVESQFPSDIRPI